MLSLVGGALGGLLGSNQNPFNSAFGSLTGGLGTPGINQFGDNWLNGYINYYYSEKAAKKENQRQIDFWNMQNAYNTPAAQMQRYSDAGLNPNLIYGQSNMASPVGTASAGSFNMPHDKVNSGPLDLMGIMQAYYGIKNMQEQNKNLQAQNSLTYSQNDFVKEQARRYAWETDEMIERGVVPGISSTPERMLQYVGSKYNPMSFLMYMLGRAYGKMTQSHPYESPAQKWYYNGAGNYSGVRL